LLAGLMFLALSACGTTDRSSVVDAREINSGELYGETAGNVGLVTGPAIAGSRPSGSSWSGTSGASGMSGDSGTASPAAGSSMSSSGSADMSQSSAMTSYGVIQSIDAIPRTQAFGMAGATMGGSTSGGSGAMTASGAPDEMVYRLTLRMDDGSTRAVIQESRPGFQPGDRVRMASNVLQRY
jgi:outer membrane lipoprotein SlyB